MIKNENNIPAGYKDSAVGIIPQEWEVARLGEICVTFKSGNTITSSNIDETGMYPVYGGNGLRGYTNKYTHEGDYVLIGRQGALCGNINYVSGKNYISEHAIAVQVNKDNELKFLAYKLDFWNLNKFSESSAQPGLSVEKLVRYKLAIPTILEQQKIVEILRTWDEAIEKQTKLIKALEKRKQALMQRLLSGRTRLPGFTGEWKHIRIENIANEYSIRNHEQSNLTVLSCTKYNGLVSSLDYFGKQIYSNDLSSYKLVPKNHFAYATNHIDEGSIGYQSDYDEALISPMYTVFRTNNKIVNDNYMCMLLKTDYMIYKYKSLMEGSIDRRGGLHWKSFASIEVKLPSLEEQIAIANILVSADDEIKRHNTKLSQLRKQKRGLMQQLLTGKRRVK